MNGTKAAETAQSTTIAAPANKCGPGKSFSARNLKKSHQDNPKCVYIDGYRLATPMNVLVKIIAPYKLIATFFFGGVVVVASHLNFSGWKKNILKSWDFLSCQKKMGNAPPTPDGTPIAGVFGSGDNTGVMTHGIFTPTRPFRRFKKNLRLHWCFNVTLYVFDRGSSKLTLVGGFNPFENISQNGNLPQIGVKIPNLSNHHLVTLRLF